jgi:hypothetical protein
MKPSPPPITDPTPSVHVPDVPKSDGRGKNAWQEKNGFYNISGRFETLTGSITMTTIKQDNLGPVANLEITVEKGRVRAYIRDGEEYQYVEATPGKPARIRGDFIYAGGWWSIRLQAVDGDAAGVGYHAWRS